MLSRENRNSGKSGAWMGEPSTHMSFLRDPLDRRLPVPFFSSGLLERRLSLSSTDMLSLSAERCQTNDWLDAIVWLQFPMLKLVA